MAGLGGAEKGRDAGDFDIFVKRLVFQAGGAQPGLADDQADTQLRGRGAQRGEAGDTTGLYDRVARRVGCPDQSASKAWQPSLVAKIVTSRPRAAAAVAVTNA